jgi:dTDP-4-dehydrorhamnose 3,5-epimerase
MHYQRPPHEEVKLVRCTRGAILDVIVDMRPGSPTRLRWEGVELTAENRVSLYVPGGFAHGYQTLADDTEVSYQVSEFHHPESEGVLLWNDPAVGIKWPIGDVVISDKDRSALPLPAGA